MADFGNFKAVPKSKQCFRLSLQSTQSADGPSFENPSCCPEFATTSNCGACHLSDRDSSEVDLANVDVACCGKDVCQKGEAGLYGTVSKGGIVADDAEGRPAVNYLELCRAWVVDGPWDTPGFLPTRVRQLLPYSVPRPPPAYAAPALPARLLLDELLLYGAAGWPADFAELGKLTIQALLLGVHTLGDVHEYFERVSEFLGVMLIVHPTSLAEPIELTAEAKKDLRAVRGRMPDAAGSSALRSHVAVPAPGLLRAVLVVMQRLLYRDADGQCVWVAPTGDPPPERDPAAGALGRCVRQLGQIFLVLARVGGRAKMLLDLHVHFSHLLCLLSDPDGGCHPYLHRWLPPIRKVHYCLRMLAGCLAAVRAAEPFQYEYEEIAQSALKTCLGLAFHRRRILQRGLKRTVRLQDDANLCPIPLAVACLSLPGAALPAAALLRELARDCPAEYSPALFAQLDVVATFLRRDLVQPRRGNLVALLYLLETVYWLAQHNRARFGEEGRGVCYALLRRALQCGHMDSAEDDAADAVEYENCVFVFAAFYLTVLFRLARPIRRWMVAAAYGAAPAGPALSSALAELAAAHGPAALLSCRWLPLRAILGQQPEDCLLFLQQRYTAPFQQLSAGVRDLTPSGMDQFVQHLSLRASGPVSEDFKRDCRAAAIRRLSGVTSEGEEVLSNVASMPMSSPPLSPRVSARPADAGAPSGPAVEPAAAPDAPDPAARQPSAVSGVSSARGSSSATQPTASRTDSVRWPAVLAVPVSAPRLGDPLDGAESAAASGQSTPPAIITQLHPAPVGGRKIVLSMDSPFASGIYG